MRNSIWLLTIGILAHSYSFGQQASAGEYMGMIGNKYNEISGKQWEYIKSTARGKNARKVDKRRQELLNTIKQSKNEIARMPKLNDNSSFRDSTVKFLQINHNVISEDYGKIIDLEEVAEQSYDLMEAYMLAKERANEKLADAAERMQIEQKRSANDNGITLVENDSKISKRMANAGEVYSYYNQVYLLFFKAYKQELYVFNAIKQKDVMAIEQNRNALNTYANEGREAIKKLSSFRGDQSVYLACRQLLQFYSEEAENGIEIFTDYLINEKNFEKMKGSFDNIKPSKRTQKDIDTYNTAVNDLNRSLNKYKETNASLNKTREKLQNNWNNKSDTFLKKFVL